MSQSFITEEQRLMARRCAMRDDYFTAEAIEFIDKMIALEKAHGAEAVGRKMAAMCNEPRPTLYGVMRELREIKSLINRKLGE